MARRLNDDEIADMAYNKIFGDLDDIHGGSMFKEDGEGMEAPQEAGEKGLAGIELSIKPIMNGAAEGGRPDDIDNNTGEDDEDDLKGISKISPLMAQLHGNR